jgi:glutamine amidotransferase
MLFSPEHPIWEFAWGCSFYSSAATRWATTKGCILPGCVTRFPHNLPLKVPHMGWNQLQVQRDSRLLNDIPVDSSAYFVHSYYCAPSNPGDIVATVDYGIPFTAVVQREHIYGVQFHPEKSQRTGLQILTNFLAI